LLQLELPSRETWHFSFQLLGFNDFMHGAFGQER